MTRLHDWPALTIDAPWPDSIEYERGIWGKVHGAPTDYRWIALTPDFGRDRPDLQSQVNLGAEDVPARFQAWRNLGDRCCAVTAYPSNAIDAAGRRGFLEKQILEWRRPAEVPAVLGALVLLPRVAELTDAIWWESNVGQLQSGIHLRIPESDHAPAVVDEDELLRVIERGRQMLRDAVPEPSLEQLYDQLLSGQQPACLSGLQRPLPPEALAALLLPLPREVADRISLAGWIPASRPSFTELGSRWDILITNPGQAAPSFSSRSRLKARHAEVVVEPQVPSPPPSAPPFRAGVELQLTPVEPEAASILCRLYEFAVAPDRRWLDPVTLAAQVRGEPHVRRESARVLSDWVGQVSKQRPDYADQRQWQVKIDLLRSAALVLVPEPATIESVGRPDAKSWVPALVFGLMFDTYKEWDRLAGFGEEALCSLLEQSLTCTGASVWSARMRPWLRRWQNESRRQDVRIPRLIGEVLKSCPP